MPRTYDIIELATQHRVYYYPFTMEGLTLAYEQLQADFNIDKESPCNWEDYNIKGFKFEDRIVDRSEEDRDRDDNMILHLEEAVEYEREECDHECNCDDCGYGEPEEELVWNHSWFWPDLDDIIVERNLEFE